MEKESFLTGLKFSTPSFYEYLLVVHPAKEIFEKLLAEKTRLEAEMVKISSLRISTADQEQKAELERKEERIIKELTDLTQIIKNKKENICRTC